MNSYSTLPTNNKKKKKKIQDLLLINRAKIISNIKGHQFIKFIPTKNKKKTAKE
jgi:hypothetical protein